MIDITTLGGQRIDENTFQQLLEHIKLNITEEFIYILKAKLILKC